MKAKVVIALVAGVVLAGCGGDNDEEGGAKKRNGDIARAAQRLESYLKKNTNDISGDAQQQGERLQVVTSVQPTGGKLKIFTGLNADVTADDEPAQEICSVARRAGVPQAKGASVVDAGDAQLARC